MGRLYLELYFVVCILCGLVFSRDIFMDSPTACSQTFPAGDREIFIVRPRGSVGVPNPPTACRVHFESSYASSNYKFEIVVESAAFRDCGVTLSIFDGQTTGSNYIRMLGCGSSTSTGHFYSKDRAITLMLTRTSTQYYHGSNFQLKVQLYYDTEAGDEFIGTYKIPAGAIVGIVLGIVVLICAAVLLGWCYKTGRLPGLSPYEYPSAPVKASTENLSKSDINATNGTTGSSNGAFVSWHNTENKTVESRSNFDLSDTRIWESLTSVNTNTSSNNARKEIRPVQPVRPPDRTMNLRKNTNNNSTNNRQPFERLDAKQLSSSPTTRMRGRRLESENQEKDQYHTIRDVELHAKDKLINGTDSFGKDKFVNLNPDKEGYMYDYDQVKKLSGNTENEAKPKTQDFGTELRDAIKRASMKRQQSESAGEGKDLSGTDTQNESSAFSSAAALNKQTDGEITGPDAQSSPKPKKKKRKSSKERKKTGKQKGGEKGDKGSPGKSKQQAESDDNNEDVPPELYAPIFSGDDEPNDAGFQGEYQPGYQGNHQPYMTPYDPRYPPPVGGYPPGMPPAGMYPPGVPGVPYQQAGQAQWYVESNPNGQQKMAFAMTTHSQSDDSLQGNRGYPSGPNYTSTPYYKSGNQGGGNNDMSMVPAGTILDDPRLPAPGLSVARYDEDPLSGVKTSQVVWTDARKDPTDPPPDSSTQITRKTITRITTRATEDELPDAPNPSLQDMSWKTARGIQEQGGQEPAFMSPTRSAYHANAIQYAPSTPERSNAGYYMGGSQQRPPYQSSYVPGTAPSVIHEAPKINDAIRDRITLQSESG